MGIILKYKFENIGKAGALTIFASLATNPSTLFLTNGLVGKFVMALLKELCMFLASTGLIVMNIGANDVEILAEKNQFDGSFDDAFKAIHATNNTLTPEQKAAIDEKCITALRKFGSYRVRDDQGTKP